MTKKPNILLITTDTQRWDTLKCMGNPHAVSPNLDRLASEGVLYTQAHTSSPVCMPTRCSLMSGLHTPVHGCIENGVNRRMDIPMVTDYLEIEGYTNIMVGKTHFGPIPKSFHIQKILEGEKGHDSNDFYAEHIRSLGYSRSSAHPNPIPDDQFMDAFLVTTTISEIEKIKATDSPFFAFCSLPSPHGPIDPPSPWEKLYDNIPLPEINYREGEIEEHPTHLRRLVGTLPQKRDNDELYQEFNYLSSNAKFSNLSEAKGNTIEGQSREDIDAFRRLYYGLAAYCDQQIGRLITYLDQSELRENTLVIFSSDHGQQFFDHGFNDKHNWYDSSWHIPFIISMPGTLPQGTQEDFAIWNDIPATILAAAGTGCDTMQGFDHFTPLKSGIKTPRCCAAGTLYTSFALVTERWKMEYYTEESTGRLFDRLNDPEEQIDLYGADRCRNLRDELLTALLSWRSELMDINFLISNTKGGGPVARRIALHTRTLKGTDAEARLNSKVADIILKYQNI